MMGFCAITMLLLLFLFVDDGNGIVCCCQWMYNTMKWNRENIERLTNLCVISVCLCLDASLCFTIRLIEVCLSVKIDEDLCADF